MASAVFDYGSVVSSTTLTGADDRVAKPREGETQPQSENGAQVRARDEAQRGEGVLASEEPGYGAEPHLIWIFGRLTSRRCCAAPSASSRRPRFGPTSASGIRRSTFQPS